MRMNKKALVGLGFLLGVGVSTTSDEMDSLPFTDLDPLILTAFNYGLATGGGMLMYATTQNENQACSFVEEHLTRAIEQNPNTKAQTDAGKLAVVAARINLDLMLSNGLRQADLNCSL